MTHPNQTLSLKEVKAFVVRLIILGIFCMHSHFMMGQITVTSSTFPVVGDKLRYKLASNPAIVANQAQGPPGYQTWDFSGLTEASTFEKNYRPASEGTNAAAFPTATMVVRDGTDEYYYKSSSSKFELLGKASSTFRGATINALHQTAGIAERHAPITFFDSRGSGSTYNLRWSYSELPNGTSPPYPLFVPDSVIWYIEHNEQTIVDAWGTLKLPDQSQFNVIRLKSTEYYFSLFTIRHNLYGYFDYFKGFSEGLRDTTTTWGRSWQDESYYLRELMLGYRIINYRFINDVSKEEIAIVKFRDRSATSSSGCDDAYGCVLLSVVYKNTTPPCPSGNILYVNAAATGANNGTSWTDAYTNLQSALSSTCAGITQIWVAKGTYYPTADYTGNTSPADARNKTFQMKNGVAIYGGFAGTEAANYNLSLRNFATNQTILSGDIDQNNTLDMGNVKNVLSNTNINNTAILDGFTVTGGYLVIFEGGGAAMVNVFSSPTIRNCIFSKNSGLLVIAQIVSSATFTNCVFVQNNGTALLNEGAGTTSLINCTISANGSAVQNNNSASTIVKNSVIWGNTNGVAGLGVFTITNSIVQGGFAGSGNLNQNPQFVNQPTLGSGNTGDLRLLACSPAIDAGTSVDAPATDLLGNLRPQGGGVDMGAYEGAVLPNTLSISDNISSGTMTFTGGVLIGANQVSNANVTYKAGSSVMLLSGFKAENTVFKAQIGAGCN